jgi:hypothetical protein
MPPQQSGGLLDLLDDGLDFRAHGRAPGRLCNRLRRRAQRTVLGLPLPEDASFAH